MRRKKEKIERKETTKTQKTVQEKLHIGPDHHFCSLGGASLMQG